MLKPVENLKNVYENKHLRTIQNITRVTYIAYLFFFLYWLGINYVPHIPEIFPRLFVAIYGTFCVAWGFICITYGVITKNLFRNHTMFMLFGGIGLVFWGLGELVWAYYTVILNIEIPYPSAADIPYLLFYPFWFVALVFFAKTIGNEISFFRKISGFITLFIVVIISAAISSSYYMLLLLQDVLANEASLPDITTFIDISYPLWDIILLFTISIIAFMVISSTKQLKFKRTLTLMCIALVLSFIADVIFGYTEGLNFTNGNVVDLMYMTTVTLLALSQFYFINEVLAEKSVYN